MASNTYGAIKLSTAEDVGAVLKKKTGSADGYKPKEWADTINLLGLLPIRTASGTIAHFSDGADDVPMKSITAQILPIQSGSGTPSHSNPRPISGTSVLDIYHSGADTSDYDTTSVTLGQTVYGGTADVVGGVGKKTYGQVDLGDISWTYYNTFFLANVASIGFNSTDHFFCSEYNNVGFKYDSAMANQPTGSIGYSGNSLKIKNTDYTDATLFKEAVRGVQFVYELATPTEYTFTGQPINSLLGVNNVWTDSGEVLDVEYRADMNLLISELGG